MNSKNLNQAGAAGFTLLELIVVIAIISVLAGILAPLVKSSLDDAKVGKVTSLVDALKKACAKYNYDTDTVPLSQDDFIRDASTVGSTWKGPYLDQPVNNSINPWGAIQYNADLSGGTLNGEGAAADGYLVSGAAITNGVEIGFEDVPLAVATNIELAIDGTGGTATTGRCELEVPSPDDGTRIVWIMLFQQ